MRKAFDANVPKLKPRLRTKAQAGLGERRWPPMAFNLTPTVSEGKKSDFHAPWAVEMPVIFRRAASNMPCSISPSVAPPGRRTLLLLTITTRDLTAMEKR